MLSKSMAKRLDIMGEEKIGVEVPTWYDGVCFWYYPKTGTWSIPEGRENICNGREEDIERIVKDMYNDICTEEEAYGDIVYNLLHLCQLLWDSTL